MTMRFTFVLVIAFFSGIAVSQVTPTIAGSSLVNVWSFELPNTTVPNGGAFWAAYSEYLSAYASTTIDGTLFLVNTSTPELMFTFSDWNDGVAAASANPSIVITTHSVLVLRGSVLHAVDTRNGLQRYSINLGQSVSSIQYVSDEWLLAIHDNNTTNPHIAMINPTNGAKLWSSPVTLSGMVTVSSTNVAAVQLHPDGVKFDVVVLNAADGSDIYRHSYSASADQMIYIMSADTASVTYIMQIGSLQKIVRATFGVTSLLPFNFTVEPIIWGYGIGASSNGGVLWFQAGESTISTYAYNWTDGAFIAKSAVVGVTPGAAHILGEPEFALLAFMGINDPVILNLTGWNVDGTHRFTFEIEVNASGFKQHSPKAFRNIRSGELQYTVTANFGGQVIFPTSNGLYFIDGDAVTFDDSLANALPGLVRENIAMDSSNVFLTYGSTVAGFSWA